MKTSIRKLFVIIAMVVPFVATTAYAYKMSSKDKRKVNRAINLDIKQYADGTAEPRREVDKQNWCLIAVPNINYCTYNIIPKKFSGISSTKFLALNDYCTKRVKRMCKTNTRRSRGR